MKYATPPVRVLLLAALAMATSVGCRRVTLVSFYSESSALTIDHVIVDAKQPGKVPLALKSLDETIGYYDLPGTEITISVWACAGSELVLAATATAYPIISDRVRVHVDRWSGPPSACPKLMDGSVADAPDAGAGAGGAAGSGEPAGVGGAPSVDGAGGQGADAGTDDVHPGVGGEGGVNTIDGGAECGDDSHGTPACDPPSGDPVGADAVSAPSYKPECESYCSGMAMTCSASYESLDGCRRYCSTVGWPSGSGTNSLGCRNDYLNLAISSPIFPSSCASAGPEGAPDCGTICENFCAAFGALCAPSPSDAAGCMASCGAAMARSTADPACRFRYLARAVFDRRYCSYVGFGSCLRCN
jgi:hypothetical protein